MIDIKSGLFASLFVLLSVYSITAFTDEAVVITSQSGCDYFIADGKRGLYVLSHYKGYQPSKDDLIIGEIGSYGTKAVYYPKQDKNGSLCVEDYYLSKHNAMELFKKYCN